MYNLKQAHRTAPVLGAILIVCASAAPAAAAEHPGSPTQSVPSVKQCNCLLERVGDQYVRCDNLTGAGVPAAAWVTEQ